MSRKKELAKNTVIIFLGKACTQLISFLLLPLYTGYLTTGQYGIVDLITTYVTLLIPLITLELEMSVFRYLVDGRGKNKDTKEIMTNDFLVLFSSLAIFTVLYFIVTMFWKIDYRFLIWIDIIICAISGNFLQITRGFGKTLDFSISSLMTGVITVISNIILIVFCHLRADGMIISMAVANGIGALYLFIKLKMYKYIDFSYINKNKIKSMYKYSVPLVPNSVSWWIVNVSDRSIITVVLGTAFNGIYAVSNKFPTILSSILGVFNLSWSESASLHIDSSDRDQFFSDICNTVVKLFSSLGLGMIACMPFIFPLLVDSKFGDAYSYIPILVLGAVFNVGACLYSSIYIAKKLTKQVAFGSIMAAVINILVNIVLIKYIGLYAAALSTAIAYCAMMIQRHIDVKKYVKITYESNLILKIFGMFLITIFMYYQKNWILNIINLLIVVLFAFVTNKQLIFSIFKTVFKKFKYNK